MLPVVQFIQNNTAININAINPNVSFVNNAVNGLKMIFMLQEHSSQNHNFQIASAGKSISFDGTLFTLGST